MSHGMDRLIERVRGGLIVSCQALDDEPLHGANIMPRMAVAAAAGGAVGIRANGAEDIRQIKTEVDLPVVGIVKRTYADTLVYITPTMREVAEVVTAGADVVSMDATSRLRPNGLTLPKLVQQIRNQFPDVILMADVSTLEEGIEAAGLGFDLVASTMSGYTQYSKNFSNPNFDLIESLVRHVDVPVIAEGHISTPEEAARCIELGCISVVVGSAITRPQVITRNFVDRIKQVQESVNQSAP
ncbi:N-acetylmannosamine-6-phosphate 2-epimerase [Alicyclobacillus fastidiosus]|uniref:Putative N-acetylmannosamine-6-phosphate 2-epimerase n=1 Tax=Alicyclobacillus fastidiosus TaxID=392011 RepID=A0ABY6ZF18_9BACL|nr:N-acetylmannosamine-6-phosphate 2-epimerase [Alicyclobacillus fastidiosus]WAH41505.1 N-acetylmannosamine-6-phosphate 2-epimerase [Alicyclobacillus fastidiosus]GMA63154.1 putative N-acetylmannosamine-6-phosphate 2-epimerase [Alicyclobacillus fastidiosus]